MFELYNNRGYHVIAIGDFNENFLPLDELIELIATAKLWIGVDTGTRNIAMIYKTPVLELGTPGKGEPNHDIFHPKEYRKDTLYHFNINLLKPEEVIQKVKEKWGI